MSVSASRSKREHRRYAVWATPGLYAVSPLVMLGLLTAPQPAFSAESVSIEEIVVTATRRATALQDTPLAITALGEDFLRDQGFDDFEDLAISVPGLEFQSSGPGSTRITMRGISSVSGSATVGVYFDDVPITSPTIQSTQPDMATYDLARVEALRGPQGTLYGEGAMGGAIRFISNKPDASGFATSMDVTGASIDGGGDIYAANAMLNMPVVDDKFALRLVGYYRDEDGWIDNTRIGVEDTNTLRRSGGRLMGKVFASKNLSVTGLVSYNHVELGDSPIFTDLELAAALNAEAAAAGSPFPAVLEPASIGFWDEEQLIYNLTIDYSLGWAELTSSSSYVDRQRELVDPLPSVETSFGLLGLDPFQTGNFDITTFAQEVRMVSMGEGPFEWTAGVFYQENERDLPVELSTRPPLGEPFVARNVEQYTQWALFGEATYHFTGQLELTLGARVAEEESEWTTVADFGFLAPLPPTDDHISKKFEQFSPKILLGYEVSDDTLVYVSAAEGYRKGGFNLLNPNAPPVFDEDSLIAYELGWKTAWFDNRLIVNGAVYYNDWDDFQAVNQEQVFVAFTENIGQAHSTGIELEVVAYPVEGLRLGIGGNLTEAELDNEFTSTGGVVLRKGNKLPGVPDSAFNASLSYTRPISPALKWVLNGTYQAVGDRFADPANTPGLELPSYSLVNARTGVETDRWSVVVFADNLTDERVAYAPGEYGALDRLVDYATNQPRTIGLKVSMNFQ